MIMLKKHPKKIDRCEKLFPIDFLEKKKINKRNVAVFQNKMCTQHGNDLKLTSNIFPPPYMLRIPQPSHVGVWRSLNDAEQ